jgi:predicted MFS family arabinose efflux permease
MFLSGTAAAGGIAMINSVANLGGQFGPWLAGVLEKRTGGYTAVLLMSSGFLLASFLLATTLRPPQK